MFKWLRKQSSFQQSLSENISILRSQKLIHQIQSLVSVTQPDFQSLYVKTIQRFSEFLAIPNRPADESALIEALNDVVLTLRKRRGYLLPLGADSETSFREQEEWTFAVFAASLLNHIEIKSRLDIAKAILPGEGFAWLHRNKKLFGLWEAYLQGDEQYNIFIKIVVPSKPVSLKNVVIQKVDSTVLPNKEDAQPLCDNTSMDKSLNESALSSPLFQAVDFWQWLKDAIIHQQIGTNDTDSIVHGIKTGVLVCIPQAIDIFLRKKSEELDINSDQVILGQRIALTKAVKKHDALIRNAQGSRVHTYCIGKWENRNVLSGIIIEAEVLLGESKILPINSALSIDPIDNG